MEEWPLVHTFHQSFVGNSYWCQLVLGNSIKLQAIDCENPWTFWCVAQALRSLQGIQMVMLNQADLSSTLLKLLFLFSVMFCCCEEVKGLSSCYLFFADSGTYFIAAYFLFLFHLGTVILGSSKVMNSVEKCLNEEGISTLYSEVSTWLLTWKMRYIDLQPPNSYSYSPWPPVRHSQMQSQGDAEGCWENVFCG